MNQSWSTCEQVGEYPIFAPGEKIHCVSICADKEHAERIVACLNVCEGISTEVLELNATAGGVATLERQRDAAIAALRAIKQEVFYGIKDGAAERIDAIVTPIIGQAYTEFPPLTATGQAHEGASNHGAMIAKLIGAPQLYTSVSKGGAYERLGAIRGAGTFKGLSGIAYRSETGDLFIREPECFAKRMVLIKPEGGAQ